MLGQEMKLGIADISIKTGENKFTISVDKLTKGMYILQLKSKLEDSMGVVAESDINTMTFDQFLKNI